MAIETTASVTCKPEAVEQIKQALEDLLIPITGFNSNSDLAAFELDTFNYDLVDMLVDNLKADGIAAVISVYGISDDDIEEFTVTTCIENGEWQSNYLSRSGSLVKESLEETLQLIEDGIDMDELRNNIVARLKMVC